MNEKTALLALYFINGLGNSIIKQLVSYFGSPSAVLQASVAELKEIQGIGSKLVHNLTSERAKAKEKAEEELIKLNRISGEILTYLEPEYPGNLKQTPDFPVLLFKKGKFEFNRSRVISIVGTRNATSYGLSSTVEIINYLKRYNPLIVSGLAYGIDITSHQEALNQGLRTVGVMASGLDIIYPPRHRNIAGKMMENGGILTEYSIGEDPDRQHFPARNRIIAGLSEVVIVVEAAVKGGALITAYMANDYDRDVFAVPGNLHSKYSEGCNHLIRNHKAHILTCPEDISYIMNWEQSSTTLSLPLDELNDTESRVINFLKEASGDVNIDQLINTLELNNTDLSSTLLQLEIKGYVQSVPGKRYRIQY